MKQSNKKIMKIEEENEEEEACMKRENINKLNDIDESFTSQIKPRASRLSRVSFSVDTKDDEKLDKNKTIDESIEESNKDHVELDASEYHISQCRQLYNEIIDNAIKVSNISSNLDSFKEYSNRSNSVFKSQYGLHHFKKKSMNIKDVKQWIFMMLEKPTGHIAFVHHLFTFSIILLTILFAAFTTMDPIKEWSENILFYIELFVIVYFFIEYCLRVWSSDCQKKYEALKGKLKFILRPIMIIELLVVIFGSLLIIGSAHIRNLDEADNNNKKRIHFGPITLSLLSLLQLVRLLYVDRKASTWLILFDVCNKHRFELISSVYIGFITLLLSSYFIFHCEKSVPGTLFRTYSDAVYWSIITVN